MDDIKKLFVEAENNTRQLAEQLLELKAKMEGHEEAEESLTSTREILQTMIAEMMTISASLQEVVTGLKGIGTPELIAAIDGVKDDVLSEIQQINNEQNGILDRFESKLSLVQVSVFAALGIVFVLLIINIFLLITSFS